MRKTNRKNRLAEGYWFIGYNKYLQVPFYKGNDGLRKIANIAFVVLKREGSWKSMIHFSCKTHTELEKFLEPLAEKLGGFTNPQRQLWEKVYEIECEKKYESTDYLAKLELFLNNDKPIIDRAIAHSDQSYIKTLSQDAFEKNHQQILHYRNLRSLVKE